MGEIPPTLFIQYLYYSISIKSQACLEIAIETKQYAFQSSFINMTIVFWFHIIGH